MSGQRDFQQVEQQWQRSYLQQAQYAAQTGEHDGTFQFLPDFKHWNLAPPIRDVAKALFDHAEQGERIQWHRFAGHGCSSQACCVNFLLPLADDPACLSRWVDHLTGTEGSTVVPIETRCDRPQAIAFEWVPSVDYLNEGGKAGVLSRGANSTSVDAAIRYQLGAEERLLLIEWKYIESYGATRSEKDRRGDKTRDQRYHNLWKRPHGPLRSDANLTLHDLHLNPWYQLLRQQMLAYHLENDPLSPFDRVHVVHLSPSGNLALRRVNGAKFQELAQALGPSATLFDVFVDLIDPAFRDRFVSHSIEWAFAPLTAEGWPAITWLTDRYPNLFHTSTALSGAAV